MKIIIINVFFIMKKEVKCKTYSLVEKYVIIGYQFLKKKKYYCYICVKET